jgi:hypothetical protein
MLYTVNNGGFIENICFMLCVLLVYSYKITSKKIHKLISYTHTNTHASPQSVSAWVHHIFITFHYLTSN